MTRHNAPKPITGKDGTVYPSILAAARAMDVCPDTLRRHLREHGNLDNVRGDRHGAPTMDAGGKVYASRSAAARALGVHVSTIKHHLEQHGDLSLVGSGSVPCVHKGKTYASITECAKALGLKRHTLAYHLAKHGNLDKAGVGKGNKGRSTKTHIGPCVFASRTKAAEALGVSRETLRKLRSFHATPQQKAALHDLAMGYHMRQQLKVRA